MTGFDADVLIAGGGPAGAATATHLARHGWDVLLLEKAVFPREKPCAEFLSPGAVSQLSELGVLEAVRTAGAAYPTGMRIVTPEASCLLRYETPALGVQRPLLDRLLLENARAAGVRVEESVRALDTLVEDGSVRGLAVATAFGPVQRRARIVVGADGPHSVVARSLGLNRPVRWPRRLGLVARYDGAATIAEYGEMHVGSDLYCGIAPVGNGVVNVGLVVGMHSKPAGEPTEHFFERKVSELPRVRTALRGMRRATSIQGIGPLARRVSRAAGPGYLLAGDAAGFLDPFTGEGVYRALRGGKIAADLIDWGLWQGQLDLSREYAEAREAAFADKERICLLIQLFLSNPWAFRYVVERLSRRPRLLERLAAVLGDYAPAAPALRPLFLGALLRP